MEREDVINEIQRLYDRTWAQFDTLQPLVVKISQDISSAHKYLLEVIQQSVSYKQFLIEYANTLEKLETIARVRPVVPDTLLYQVRDLLGYLLSAETYIDKLRNFIVHGEYLATDEEDHSRSNLIANVENDLLMASNGSQAAQSAEKPKIDWNLVVAVITFLLNLLVQMNIEAQTDKQHEELIQKLDEIRITIEQQVDEADEDDKK